MNMERVIKCDDEITPLDFEIFVFIEINQYRLEVGAAEEVKKETKFSVK